jgi:hypothetical protein
LKTARPKEIFSAALTESFSCDGEHFDALTLFLFTILEGLPGNFPMFIHFPPLLCPDGVSIYYSDSHQITKQRGVPYFPRNA